MLDWDSTSIVFTKRSLIEFLKQVSLTSEPLHVGLTSNGRYTGTTVDPNFTNIQKLPRTYESHSFILRTAQS